MRRAFVSHSTADDRYVAEMESFLRAAGFDDVFNDVRSIPPGAEFWPEIEKGIAAADTLVVVITAASNGSEWVKREIDYALSLSRKIIPVWIEDCPVPAFLKNRDVIDFRPRTREARRIDISRIIRYAPAELIGRDDEKKLLSEAWAKTLRGEAGRPTVVTFVALGGEGKTSLVAKWAVDELLARGWPGCDAAFAWSFYSQGTREQQAASSDLFLKAALTFFGDDADKAFAASPAGAFEKGQRLARLVGQRRSLLILDGLEPLQYAPTAPTPGELKDQGVAALLKGLAAASHGMCVVTTRYSLPDLKAFWQTTAPELKLLRLSPDAGVHLLKTLGVRGTAQEFATLVEDVKGHALTLTLLGGFLKRAFHGDIRQRDRVKFEKADEKMDGGHAFRTMAAYEQWLLRDGGDEGRREVAVLRLMGLFDRPADAGCLNALLQPPVIPGLTEPLVGIAEEDWNFSLDSLQSARLLTLNRGQSSFHNSSFILPTSLDAHPLLREYFAQRLKNEGRSMKAGSPPSSFILPTSSFCLAHRRLYEHLCRHKEGDQPTLEDLQPLYQAVAHGCQAGLQQEAWRTYAKRIKRKKKEEEDYALRKTGCANLALNCIANFFEKQWSEVTRELSFAEQGNLLHHAGVCIRMSGGYPESLTPLKASWEIATRIAEESEIENAANRARSIGQIYSTMGYNTDALMWAKLSIEWADKGKPDNPERIQSRSKKADLLVKQGEFQAAKELFREAESIAKVGKDDGPQLFSFPGYLYCELLLHLGEINEVSTRVEKWPNNADNNLEFGLRYLTSAMLKNKRGDSLPTVRDDFNVALACLRSQGQRQTASALIQGAIFEGSGGDRTIALGYLNEAFELAERGSMQLLLADIHLYRARIFFREKEYPWSKDENGKPRGPKDDLAAARKLIKECGYWRRKEELEDAEKVIGVTSAT